MDPRAIAAMQAIDPAQIDAFARDLGASATERGIDLDGAGVERAFLAACEQGWFGASGHAAVTGAPAAGPAFQQAALTPEQEFFEGYAERRQEEDVEQQRIAMLAQQAEEDAGQFEQRLGRKMTDREATRLAAEQLAQVTRGAPLDVDQAAAAAGVKSYDAMNSREQAAAMAERMRELDPQRGQDADRVFDLDNSRDADDYMVMRLQGHEFQDEPDEGA